MLDQSYNFKMSRSASSSSISELERSQSSVVAPSLVDQQVARILSADNHVVTDFLIAHQGNMNNKMTECYRVIKQTILNDDPQESPFKEVLRLEGFIGESEDDIDGANDKIFDKSNHDLKGVSMNDEPRNEPQLGHQTSNFGALQQNLHGENAKQVVQLFESIRSSQENHAQELFEVARNTLSDMVKDHPSAYKEFGMVYIFGDPEEFYESRDDYYKRQDHNCLVSGALLGLIVILFLGCEEYIFGNSFTGKAQRKNSEPYSLSIEYPISSEQIAYTIVGATVVLLLALLLSVCFWKYKPGSNFWDCWLTKCCWKKKRNGLRHCCCYD